MSLADAGQAHAFVASLDAPALSTADRHHFERVLRLRFGVPITVADGAGAWRICRFGRELEVEGPIEHEPVAEPEVGVAFAVMKGDRPELVVQKLTELGVDVIAPFVAARSVVKWHGERAVRHHERLQRVVREAAMQCRRAHLPRLEPVTTFSSVAARVGACLATQSGQPVDLHHPFVLVGPEGGWSPDELASVLPRVGLGPYVLRSETAAVAAGALLVALRERFVGGTF